MTWRILINSVDLASIDCYAETIGQWRDAPARQFPTVAIPGRQGVLIASDPVTAPRTLRLKVMIDPAARTVAARQTAEDTLRALAYNGLVKIVEDDGVRTVPRAIDGVCQSCVITPRRHPVVDLVSDADLTILCPDPTWYDTIGQIIGFNATASPVPLGTAVSGGVVEIAAPSWSANVEDPELVYYNAAMVEIARMTFDVELAAGDDYLSIDLDRSTITLYESGVASDGVGLLTAGDFFSLDPQDGEPLSASFPLLALEATAGTPSGRWLGTKRWL